MLEYVLLEGEEIKLLSDKSLLKVEDKEIPITTLITNQRMMLFDYPKDEESFRSGPQINPIVRMKKEIILETPLSEIEKIAFFLIFLCNLNHLGLIFTIVFASILCITLGIHFLFPKFHAQK